MYKILEARIEFKNNQLERITVLVEISKGDVWAIYATTTPKAGYMLQPNATISNELLQEVADKGLESADRDKLFPKWKLKHVNSL